MNTWKQQQKNANETEYATWTHPNQKIVRQIDYILVNQRYRNCVTNCKSIRKWYANPNLEGQQHNVTRLDFQLSLAKRGARYVGKSDKRILNYDLKELRQDPNKLLEYLDNNKKEHEEALTIEGLSANDAINKMDKYMCETVQKVYPLKKDTRKDPNADRYTTYLNKKWGSPEELKAEQEITQAIDYHKKKSANNTKKNSQNGI